MNCISETEVHPYLALFKQHVEQLRKHLSGFCKQLPSANSRIGGVLWTAEEKDAFFHALSVHSRLRPDLIAACVGTKNEVEVLEYLSLLAGGSKKAGSSEECLRANLYFAREVSDAWIAWEEENAERLRLNEAIWNRTSSVDGEDRQLRDEEESTEYGYPNKQPLGGLKHLNQAHLHVLGEMLHNENDHGPDTGLVPSSPIEKNHPTTTEMGIISSTQVPGRSDSGTLTNPTNSHQSPDLSEEDTSAYLQSLSPRSRRRYQKRIHMRRKRAELKGKQTDLTLHKLKTGRRNGKEKEASPEASSSMATGNMQIEPRVKSTRIISEDVTDQTSTIVSGEQEGNDPSLDLIPRRHYLKARSDLSLNNVSLDSITAMNLDVFNYPKMRKLLELFIAGYDSNLVDQNASISTETCILFLEILRDFLVQVIPRVITLEEEYKRFRGTTKVWRKNNDEGTIDLSTIQLALKSMGIVEENLAQYFAGLLGEDCHSATYNQTEYDDNEGLVNQPNILNQHPLHQDVCLAHYHCDLFQENGRHAEGPDNVIEDINNEMLIDEMQEERELEREDEIADHKYETALWREVPSRRKNKPLNL